MTGALVEVAKVGLLSFIVLGVLAVAVVYYRRRRSGVTSWRPENSRILGYDAPLARMDELASPSHVSGRLTCRRADEGDVVRLRGADDSD